MNATCVPHAITRPKHAVGVRKVVGNAEGLGLVVIFPAELTPDDPLAGTAARLAITQRQTSLELPVIRLATRLETAAGRSGIQQSVTK